MISFAAGYGGGDPEFPEGGILHVVKGIPEETQRTLLNALKAGASTFEEQVLLNQLASSSSGMSCVGTLRKVFTEKGFGFISPDDGGDDVFVHVKDNPDLVGCQAGVAVRYDLVWDDRKGKYKGTNLTTCSC